MKRSVILVDDDVVINMMQTKVVQLSGMDDNPLVFTTGKKAVDYLVNERNKYHKALLLLDLNMPEWDGWRVLEALQNQGLEDKLDVYIVSSSVDQVEIDRSEKNLLVRGFISKPLSIAKCNQLKADVEEREAYEETESSKSA